MNRVWTWTLRPSLSRLLHLRTLHPHTKKKESEPQKKMKTTNEHPERHHEKTTEQTTTSPLGPTTSRFIDSMKRKGGKHHRHQKQAERPALLVKQRGDFFGSKQRFGFVRKSFRSILYFSWSIRGTQMTATQLASR